MQTLRESTILTLMNPDDAEFQKLLDTIAELSSRLAELHASWPAHSVPPNMMEALDALEEKLAEAQKRLNLLLDDSHV